MKGEQAQTIPLSSTEREIRVGTCVHVQWRGSNWEFVTCEAYAGINFRKHGTQSQRLSCQCSHNRQCRSTSMGFVGQVDVVSDAVNGLWPPALEAA